MTHKLLIVDDELPNLRLLERLFSNEYHCLTASSGPEAIRLLEHHDVAILITDQRMPEMTGIDLLKRSAQLRPHMVRILLTGYTDVEALEEAINCGLVYMYVTKPWNNDDLKVKISRAREHYENNKKRNSLKSANDRLLRALGDTKLALVNGLADMLRCRDQGEYDHALRVSRYATAIGESLALSDEEKEDLSAAALLHGLEQKESFRNHSPRMQRSDNRSMIAREHSKCEARLLAAIPAVENVNDIIKFHRENFDGTGPGGLMGEQIPLGSRILRVVDEYDSLIQPKASVARMQHNEAMQFLSQRSRKQFDPGIVEILSQLSPADVDNTDRFATTGDSHPAVANEGFEPAFVDATAW
jgi:response regulator RpfG family c-di-GMP phosphodiesterase